MRAPSALSKLIRGVTAWQTLDEHSAIINMRLDVALLLNMLKQSKNSASKTNLTQRHNITVKNPKITI
jgi:hypothetical protein